MCSEEKPATVEHFAKLKGYVGKDGYARAARFESRCRPCLRSVNEPYLEARHERNRKAKAMEETKICTKCCKELPIEEFYCTLVKATDKRRAYTYVRTPCKKCFKTYTNIKYQNNKGKPGAKPKSPLPTREELAEWFAAGCPLEGRRAA